MSRIFRLLSVFLISSVIALTAAAVTGALEDMTANIVSNDGDIYAGGIFDMYAGTNAEGASYQWFARYGRDGGALPLEDNGSYSGMQTSHFRLVTSDTGTYGDDWENIFFNCRITAPDGTVAWTSMYNMHIWSRAQLRKDLSAEDLHITESGIKGYSPSDEENGTSYYDIPAGETLSLSMRYNPVPMSKYGRSEVTGEVEVTVSCDGKTVMLQSPYESFTPRKTGVATVSVVYRAYINGKYVMTIDEKQLVIRLTVPDWETEATSKGDYPVLAERYSESERLAQMSKGQRVLVISDGGTWCRVLAGDTVGYVPSSCLDISPVISRADLRMQEPCYGVPASMTAEVLGKGCRLFHNDPVMWYDVTSDRFLDRGEQFVLGHTYRALVWLETEGSNVFSTEKGTASNVTGTVNGRAVKVAAAYEQDPSKVIEVTVEFTHLHDPKRVNQVNPTCVTDGKLTYYSCSCGMDFEDNRAERPILDENWGIIPARGHKESEWMSNGAEHYKVCLRRECGETIPGTKGTHSGGEADCHTLAVCEVCGLGYGSFGSHTFSDSWNYADDTGHGHRCTNPMCTEHTATEPHVTQGGKQCVLCGFTAGAAAPDTGPAAPEDPGMSDWAKDEVNAAIKEGLVPENLRKGYREPVKRGEITQLFLNLIEKSMGKTAAQIMAERGLTPDYGKFTDTDDVNVVLCNALGIINGTSETKFSPEKTLKRAHVAALINRIAALHGFGTDGYVHGFSDITGNYSWVDPELGWPVEAGIIKGVGGGRFNPGGDLTLEQTILIVYRAFVFFRDF
ncbi:MAG: S-layer homology domain-containing protein [Clostridia bacterium]|nr:S-layer homology domain-containing protein [Clostridia bacterium]